MQKYCQGAVLFLFLIFVFSQAGCFALDGKSIIADDSVFCAYCNVSEVYNKSIDLLQNLNKPENSAKKVMIDQAYAIGRPNFLKGRTTARSKACAANMRVLLGATEMYNMDNAKMISSLDIPLLVNGQYLKSAPHCPSDGKYSAQGDLVKDGKIVCTVHGDVDNLKTDSDNDDRAQIPETLDGLVQKILSFHQQEICRPTGGLWFSTSGQFSPKVIFQASIKPKIFYDLLISYKVKLPTPILVEPSCVRFRIELPTPKPVTLVSEILPDGIIIGTGFSSSGKGWDDFRKNVQSPKTIFALELDGKMLLAEIGKNAGKTRMMNCCANMRVLTGGTEMYNMDHSSDKLMKSLDVNTLTEEKYLKSLPKCPSGGNYSAKGDLSSDGEVMCSIHGTVMHPVESFSDNGELNLPDPRLKTFTSLRFLVETKRAQLMAGFGSSQDRADIKSKLDEGVKLAQEKLSSGQGGAVPQIQEIKAVLDRVETFDKDGWVGLKIENADPKAIITLVTGAAGIASAIAIPNMRKARDDARKRACFANMRVLTGAVEMYNMDHDKMMEKFDVEVLVKDQYLKSAPKCADDGNYLMEGSIADFHFKCSVHGSIPE